MIAPKFYGKIKGGKVEHQSPELFNNYLSFHFKEDQEVEITVKKKFKKRSSGQPGEEANINGYYWMVVVRLIADEIGEIDQEIVHQWIQTAVGNVKVMRDGSKVPAGTSNMSGAEFAEYCSRVRMWAGNPDGLNMFIPQPNEASY